MKAHSGNLSGTYRVSHEADSDRDRQLLSQATAIVVAYLAGMTSRVLSSPHSSPRCALRWTARLRRRPPHCRPRRRSASRRAGVAGRCGGRRDDPAVPIAESVTPDYIVSWRPASGLRCLSDMCARSASRPRATVGVGACRRTTDGAPNYAAFRSGIGRALGRRELASVTAF